MMPAPLPRVRRYAVGLLALALLGLSTITALDHRQTAAQAVAPAPACSSCDARHAHLAALRSSRTEAPE